MDERQWINLTLIDSAPDGTGTIERDLIVKKSWIVGLVDMGQNNIPPTALLLGNHGLPMVSVKESMTYIMERLEG